MLRSFSRVDLLVDSKTGLRIQRQVYPPTPVTDVSNYEGRPVTPDASLMAIAARAAALADGIKHEEIGIYLETPFERTTSPESPLGNLYTDALLASADADISMHRTNTSVRADLPAGELKFGSVYEMDPFDNQIAVIELSGAELRQVISEQAHQGRFRVNFSGMNVQVTCTNRNMAIEMQLMNGHEIEDQQLVSIAVVNYLALGGDRVFSSVMPAGGYDLQLDGPLSRDLMIAWLQQRGGSINASDFSTDNNPKWSVPDSLDKECRLN